MANKLTIQHKRSSTAGAAPTAATIAVGELAINFADKQLYTKDATNTIIPLIGSSYINISSNAILAGPTAPLVRDDTSALEEGDLWYDTVNDTLMAWDGLVWFAVGGNRAFDEQIFTASGTWTKPVGFSANSIVEIYCIGAGSGGGKPLSGGSIDGGGGGAGIIIHKRLAELGATEVVTVGAGGIGKTGIAGDGANGGSTSFGAHLISSGGVGSLGGAAASGGGSSFNGADGNITDTASVQRAFYGGGAGGGIDVAVARFGSKSIFAGRGGNGSTATGVAGTAPGGGGGSGAVGGGLGARGQVRVRVFG